MEDSQAKRPRPALREPAYPEAVEEMLLRGPRRYSRADVVRASGTPEARTRQIWRALGFPLAGEDELAFTDGDVQALLAGRGFIEAGLISADSEVMMTRQLGHHLSRLAEWQVDTIWSWLRAHGEMDAESADFTELVDRLLPQLERLQNHVWRRHLAACAARMMAAPGEAQDTLVQAVGFADMVSYTRMTRGLGEAALDRVLDRFEGLAGDVIAENRGSLVKTIGDEVLFTAPTPEGAAEIALTLTEQAAADSTVPPLRTGVAYGSVLRRYGDVHGPVVNVAARLTSVARPNTVLVSEPLAQCLTEDQAGRTYTIRTLRPVSVRGYNRLRSAVLRRRTD